MRLTKIGFAVLFLLALGSAGTYAEFLQPVDDRGSVDFFDEFAFKFKGGGVLDPDAGTMEFAGQASHVGQFSCTGQFIASELHFAGDYLGSNGGTGNCDVFLVELAPGEYSARLEISGQLAHGHFYTATGTGTLLMDPDFMFTLEVEGTLRKCLLKKCQGL